MKKTALHFLRKIQSLSLINLSKISSDDRVCLKESPMVFLFLPIWNKICFVYFGGTFSLKIRQVQLKFFATNEILECFWRLISSRLFNRAEIKNLGMSDTCQWICNFFSNQLTCVTHSQTPYRCLNYCLQKHSDLKISWWWILSPSKQLVLQ